MTASSYANIDFIKSLKELRQNHNNNDSGSDKEEFLIRYMQNHFSSLRDIMEDYCNLLSLTFDGSEKNHSSITQQPTTTEEEGEEENEKKKKKKKKFFILQVRSALRIGLFCSSFQNNKQLRYDMVTKAVNDYNWHQPIIRLLMMMNSQRKGDSKIQILACQLLSNLVTCHYEAAETILSSLALSPSKHDVTERIRNNVVTTITNTNDNNEAETDVPTSSSLTETTTNNNENTMKPNWVDVILSCANNRGALAGIVAAMHNAIISLDNDDDNLPLETECCAKNANSHSNSNSQQNSFVMQLASDSLLVSTLLRQIISLQSIGEAVVDKSESLNNTNNDESLADSATEWITLVLVKCCKLGFLPELIIASAGSSDCDYDCSYNCDPSHPSSSPHLLTGSASSEINIVPEHVVLFECIRRELETFLATNGKHHDHHLLGGEAGDDSVVSTHVFLSELFCSLRKRFSVLNLSSSLGSKEDPGDDCLNCSATMVVLEILSSSLGSAIPCIALTRKELGKSSTCALIQDASYDLATLVDSISSRNALRKSRDFIMSQDEQRVVTSLVQLIGNLCFQCRQNQDLVRLTTIPTNIQIIVPSSNSNDTTTTTTTTTVSQERKALHVVLSCTSLAHCCFTLREWSVIAIRNLLDNNELNQAVVAELEANQPVQSAELAGLGIKVGMDSKGKVSVVPTDDDNESSN